MTRHQYLERASVLVFKDAATRDLIIAMQFLAIFSDEHQNVKPVNHQQKLLI